MLSILTNSRDATASFLITFLEKSGLPFIRFDTDLILNGTIFDYRAGEPRLRIDNTWYKPEHITQIWYRRPEQLKHQMFDDTPEGQYTQAEWTEFIENFFAHVPKQKWVNHPSSNAAASRKLKQLTSAAALGIRIPDTLVTQQPDELQAFYAKHQGRVIVKPLSTGYVERSNNECDSLIYTNLMREDDLLNLDNLRVCPTLFQELIDKACDVRITIIDSDITAIALVAKGADGAQRCDIRRNNMSGVTYSKIDLPNAVKLDILNLMANYNLRFAAIDMVVSKAGDWYFLEINPNGQWAWLDTSAGTNIAGAFVNAFSRFPAKTVVL